MNRADFQMRHKFLPSSWPGHVIAWLAGPIREKERERERERERESRKCESLCFQERVFVFGIERIAEWEREREAGGGFGCSSQSRPRKILQTSLETTNNDSCSYSKLPLLLFSHTCIHTRTAAHYDFVSHTHTHTLTQRKGPLKCSQTCNTYSHSYLLNNEQ